MARLTEEKHMLQTRLRLRSEEVYRPIVTT